MTKKIKDIDDYLEEIKKTKPAILQCSYAMARKIREKSGELIDLNLLTFLSSLTIQPSDKLPDHIVFFCDKKGSPFKMINLTERKAWRKAGVRKEERFES